MNKASASGLSDEKKVHLPLLFSSFILLTL